MLVGLASCQSEELSIISDENGSELSIVPLDTEEYLTYRIDDQIPVSYTRDITCMVETNRLIIRHEAQEGELEDQDFEMEFGKPGDVPLGIGTYDVINGLKLIDYHGNTIDQETTSDIEVTITSFSTLQGDYIDFTFNGTFIDDVGARHTIVGLVHAYRDN